MMSTPVLSIITIQEIKIHMFNRHDENNKLLYTMENNREFFYNYYYYPQSI